MAVCIKKSGPIGIRQPPGALSGGGWQSPVRASLRHASVEERPALSSGELLVRGQLLAARPFFLFLGPLRLCGVPLLDRPFLDLGRLAGLGGLARLGSLARLGGRRGYCR